LVSAAAVYTAFGIDPPVKSSNPMQFHLGLTIAHKGSVEKNRN